MSVPATTDRLVNELIVVCICTYRRPRGLARLLDRLRDLETDAALHVVVIDNDERADGMTVVESLPEDYPYPVHAERQTRSGITYSRNAAMRAALARDPVFIAMLDDDEWPEPQWLAELLRVQRETDADAVGGPTRSVFPDGTSEALKRNPYYGADLDLADGAPCQLQAAGNVLLRAAVIRPLAPDVFDHAFAHSCGEDLDFFTRLADRGARMHWARRAIVHEEVEPVRLTEAWMASRVRTIANSRVRVMQRLRPGLLPSSVRAAKTVALGAQAALLSAVALLDTRRRANARRLRWKFAGKLGAHFQQVTRRMDES